MLFDLDLTKKLYSSLEKSQKEARKFFGRPITFIRENFIFSS